MDKKELMPDFKLADVEDSGAPAKGIFLKDEPVWFGID